MTNLERIRAMTDEELFEAICNNASCSKKFCPAWDFCEKYNVPESDFSCEKCIRKWLESEVKSDEHS